MGESCDNGKRKIDMLILAVQQVHTQHHTRIPMNFVAFNLRVSEMIYSQVLDLEPSGGTAISTALQTLLDKAKGSQAILVSDGQSYDQHECFETCEKLAGKMVVHTVACGEDADEELLRTIAELTGGLFFKAGNPIDLPNVFKELAAKAVAALTEGKRRV